MLLEVVVSGEVTVELVVKAVLLVTIKISLVVLVNESSCCLLFYGWLVDYGDERCLNASHRQTHRRIQWRPLD